MKNRIIFSLFLLLIFFIPYSIPAQDSVMPLSKTVNTLEDQINPFHQQNIVYDQLNCYGGGDYDGNGIGQGDIDAAQAGIKDDRIEVNGDSQVNNQDANLLQNYKDGNSSKLPSWWNFSDKEEKSSWLDKMLAIDQIDTITYRPGEFTSGYFAEQLHINFHGYREDPSEGREIPEVFNKEENGRFNIPIYYSALTTQTNSHGMNACLIGEDPTNFYDWQFIEPQYDQYNDLRNFGENWNPSVGSLISITKVDKFKENGYFDAIPLVKFKIDSNGIPILNGEPNPNLLLTRPTVAIGDEKRNISEGYLLEQNYPNPFNPTTTISFTIPQVETRHALYLQLIVYDISGKQIVTLAENANVSGNYTVEWNAAGYPSGIYFYQLQNASEVIATRKMLLMK